MQLVLECFDGPADQETAPPDPTETSLYQGGYAAGQAAARAEMASEQAQLSAALVQEISDMSFGFTEAQEHIITQLTTFIERLFDTLLPETLSESLHVQLKGLVLDALEKDARSPAVLAVHPEQIEAVQNALQAIEHPFLTVKGDASLSTFAAIASTPLGETHLDTALALNLIAGVAENFMHAVEGASQ